MIFYMKYIKRHSFLSYTEQMCHVCTGPMIALRCYQFSCEQNEPGIPNLGIDANCDRVSLGLFHVMMNFLSNRHSASNLAGQFTDPPIQPVR